MSITDKKGINVTSGFKLISGQPIDARFIVEDETELQTIVTNGAVYEGLHVWVKSLGKEKVWNGTEFTEIQASGGSSESTKAIVDVDKLPHIIETGTQVPYDSYLGKIYINKHLSIDKIKAIFDSLTLIENPVGFGNAYFPLIESTSLTSNNGLILVKMDDNEYFLSKLQGSEAINIFYYNSSTNEITWSLEEDYIEFPFENIISLVAGAFGMDLQNEKIKDFVSITPFEDYSEVNKDVIYRLIIESNLYDLNYRGIDLNEYAKTQGLSVNVFFVNELPTTNINYILDTDSLTMNLYVVNNTINGYDNGLISSRDTWIGQEGVLQLLSSMLEDNDLITSEQYMTNFEVVDSKSDVLTNTTLYCFKKTPTYKYYVYDNKEKEVFYDSLILYKTATDNTVEFTDEEIELITYNDNIIINMGGILFRKSFTFSTVIIFSSVNYFLSDKIDFLAIDLNTKKGNISSATLQNITSATFDTSDGLTLDLYDANADDHLRARVSGSDIQNILPFDEAPTEGSTNLVESGNIKKYVDEYVDSEIEKIDDKLTDTVNNIKTVNEMPYYNGSTVYDDGNTGEILDKIYFNTQLRSYELKEIIFNSGIFDNIETSSTGYKNYYITVYATSKYFDGVSNLVIISLRKNMSNSMYSIVLMNSDAEETVLETFYNGETDEWDTNLANPFIIDYNEGVSFSYGQNNELIKNIVSATPFFDTTNTNLIYKYDNPLCPISYMVNSNGLNYSVISDGIVLDIANKVPTSENEYEFTNDEVQVLKYTNSKIKFSPYGYLSKVGEADWDNPLPASIYGAPSIVYMGYAHSVDSANKIVIVKGVLNLLTNVFLISYEYITTSSE